MSNKMNLIFEPADLDQASPATVSRCGMIYLEPSQLGWKPLLDSYVNTLKKNLLPEQMELFLEMIEWLIPICFTFIFHHCKLFIMTSEIHLFQVTLADIVSCFLFIKNVSKFTEFHATIYLHVGR